MRKYEADIIKIAATIAAGPRWTALVHADGATFRWAGTEWWDIASAVSAMLFAVVETYAAAYIMRAWRASRGKPEQVLLYAWIAILATLVVVMAPAIYINATQGNFQELPKAFLAFWSLCVMLSTFSVVGGVGYAEKTLHEIQRPQQEEKRKKREVEKVMIEGLRHPDKFKVFMTIKDQPVKHIKRRLGVSTKTIYDWKKRIEANA